jgi:cyclopropane fatty-acyl-phospholipid synthase-like methyltransferase
VQVTGIELAEEIVKLVQERAVDLGLSDKVNFLLQDAVLADFESETFSIIHFGESLMHFKHEDKVPMLKKVKVSLVAIRILQCLGKIHSAWLVVKVQKSVITVFLLHLPVGICKV